ncbi:hypothetical protein ASG39_06475 [Rhizobium sp. Leaf371]|uniref:serine O-acetyltransferase n=1 Tax=Rhizobium sp. Leaf371 TaxID=1736355 RepID=UPI00071233AD|nr:serine acetyltransferase [Rhizobium sp. Leaf371]KQS67973.1 hypothetical protein ASG39_06475 [Rhizobium sp. Leaf371]
MKFWDVVKADMRANASHANMLKLLPTFIFNPGFSAIFLHRVACKLRQGGVVRRRLGLLVWRWNVGRSACHINLDSDIAPGLFLPHPTGIVIGSGARIGPGTTIYQSVTIGKTASPQYPVIGAGCVLYPNSLVIGPLTLGDRAIVGAGSVVLKSVPADGVVVGTSAKVLRVGQPENAVALPV